MALECTLIRHVTFKNTRELEVQVTDPEQPELDAREVIRYGLDVPLAKIRSEQRVRLEAKYGLAPADQGGTGVPL